MTILEMIQQLMDARGAGGVDLSVGGSTQRPARDQQPVGDEALFGPQNNQTDILQGAPNVQPALRMPGMTMPGAGSPQPQSSWDMMQQINQRNMRGREMFQPSGIGRLLQMSRGR